MVKLRLPKPLLWVRFPSFAPILSKIKLRRCFVYKCFFKRLFDVILSLLAIIILSPILLILALAVKIDSPGPIIFKQQRIGKNGKVFNIYKFRSMCVGAEKTGSGVYSDKSDKRVTKVGKFLRATSLDELPQFFNVLFGHMSFIGPRPPLTYHPWTYDKYTEEQLKMFDVRPGITGWAQVNGRREVEWNKRIKLNVYYVENVSLLLDLKIIFMTIGKVFSSANNENKGATVIENKNLELMYITNNPSVAKVADEAGVDYIFVDMEYIGKEERQKGNTVKNHHTVLDVKTVKDSVKNAKVLVRCNPVHDEDSEKTSSTEEEINSIVKAGADYIMLPYFKTVEEVKRFLSAVNGRAKTMLLLETPEAVEVIDEILELSGIDKIHIGLNDLSLGYGQNFMFEPLVNGTVDMLAKKFKAKNIPYGFGGIASLGKGMVPAEMVIKEHYRLGSTMAILSRSFCNTQLLHDVDEIKKVFNEGLNEIRVFERDCQVGKFDFEQNRQEIKEAVSKVVEKIKEEKQL